MEHAQTIQHLQQQLQDTTSQTDQIKHLESSNQLEVQKRQQAEDMISRLRSSDKERELEVQNLRKREIQLERELQRYKNLVVGGLKQRSQEFNSTPVSARVRSSSQDLKMAQFYTPKVKNQIKMRKPMGI